MFYFAFDKVLLKNFTTITTITASLVRSHTQITWRFDSMGGSSEQVTCYIFSISYSVPSLPSLRLSSLQSS